MPDTLSETQACDLLSRLFRARGYSIVRNLMFREYGASFHVDGWDAKARVGFEFLTSEDEDHDDLTLDEYKALMAAQQRGELSLFIIDEVEPLSADELTDTASDFLDEVEAAAKAQRAAAARPRKALGKAAKKQVRKAAKPAVRKTRAKKKLVKTSVRKAAPRKAAKKKAARKR